MIPFVLSSYASYALPVECNPRLTDFLVALTTLAVLGLVSGEFFRFMFLSESQNSQFRFLEKIDTNLGQSHMRLIITRKGWIGLGPSQFQSDDFIFVLKGCSAPVLLRPFRDGYKVVGMVFIRDIMRGELIDFPASH